MLLTLRIEARWLRWDEVESRIQQLCLLWTLVTASLRPGVMLSGVPVCGFQPHVAEPGDVLELELVDWMRSPAEQLQSLGLTCSSFQTARPSSLRVDRPTSAYRGPASELAQRRLRMMTSSWSAFLLCFDRQVCGLMPEVCRSPPPPCVEPPPLLCLKHLFDLNWPLPLCSLKFDWSVFHCSSTACSDCALVQFRMPS